MNCLNFGNPEHPEVMWQLIESIEGMAEACESLGLPVIGGNVSLYNESGGRDIDPTPVIGLLGVIERLVSPPPGWNWRDGDALVLVGDRLASGDEAFPLGGSRWATRRGRRGGRLFEIDLDALAASVSFVAHEVARICAGEAERHQCRARRGRWWARGGPRRDDRGNATRSKRRASRFPWRAFQ